MPPKKSVLYVITKANWGGAQKYVYLLARGAANAGYQVAVAYGEPGVLTEKLGELGIETIQVPALGRDVDTKKDAGAYRALVELFKTRNPDIVHINSAKAGGLGALAARRVGIAHIIFTAHGWAFNESRPAWQRALIWMLSGVTVSLSHTTICVSEANYARHARVPGNRAQTGGRIQQPHVPSPPFKRRRAQKPDERP